MEQLRSEKPIGAKGGVINTSLSRCFGCELVFEDILGRINDHYYQVYRTREGHRRHDLEKTLGVF